MWWPGRSRQRNRWKVRGSIPSARGKARQQRHGVLPGVGAVAEAVAAVHPAPDVLDRGHLAVAVEVEAGQHTRVARSGEGMRVLDRRLTPGQIALREPAGVGRRVLGLDIEIDFVEHQNVGADALNDPRRGQGLRIAAGSLVVDIVELRPAELLDVEGGDPEGHRRSGTDRARSRPGGRAVGRSTAASVHHGERPQPQRQTPKAGRAKSARVFIGHRAILPASPSASADGSPPPASTASIAVGSPRPP